MIVSALLTTLLLAAAPADSARHEAAPADSARHEAAPTDSARSAPASPDTAQGGAARGHAVRPVLTVPEVVIAGRRISDAALRMPTAAVVERSVGGVAAQHVTLSEVLGSLAGVHVSDYGGLGGFSTVSLRSLPSNQVAMLLDGVPLGTAAEGAFDLSALPVAALERVEVYRGTGPLMLGVSAPAGAVNLVTLAAPHVQELRAQRGPFGTWEGRGSFGARRGPFALQALGSGFTTRGDFVYHDRNGTDLDPSDDGDSLRLNNRRDVTTGLASVSWRARGWGAAVRQLFEHRALGLPGTGATPALNARLVENWSHSRFELGHDARGVLPRVTLTGAADVRHQSFRDTEGKLAVGRHDTHDAIRAEQVALAIERPARPGWLVAQGQASLRRERADLTDPLAGGAPVPESRRWARGATLDLELRPAGPRLLLHAAKRWERLEDHLRAPGLGFTTTRTDVTREIVTPQLGLRLVLGGGWDARANWSEGWRAPDFLELFGNQGAVQGNPALTPERVRNRDAGLTWSGRARGVGAHLEAWRFATNADDLILLVRNSQSTLKATNVSRMDDRGTEASAAFDLPAGFTLSGSGTWQRARDRGGVRAWNGRALPLRPDRELHLDGAWRGRWVRAEVALHDIGADYVDRYNTVLIPRRRLWSVALRVTPPELPLSAALDLKNLTDDRASDLAGYPLPGRALFVTLDWRFGPAEPGPTGGEQP